MAKQDKAVTKKMLVGSQVIDAEGHAVGTVNDVAFVVDKMGLSLYVEGKRGEGRNAAWEEVQAVGDLVALKPAKAQVQQSQAAAQTWSTYDRPLRYIEQYQRGWCGKDQKYV